MRSLADGKTKVTILPKAPADPKAITVAELTAGIEASCAILASDYNVGAATSESVDEKALCQPGNAATWGAENGTIEFTLFLEFGDDKHLDLTSDAGKAFEAVKHKGTQVYIVQRDNDKLSTDPWAAGDEYEYFHGIADHPQHVDRTGYTKRKITAAFQSMELHGVVATGG
ncbi:hypothetical protein M3G00_07805 [Brevibacterium casei]|uniref:phage tail tube protein n=1 Tax=Brevibacterium casei TaxID=33889 RepID=UPI00223B1E24|nr:hypothetical protein [Brevibacterium casei]MCT2182839.1 hypothetical protein [Brevibacterium casei]